MKIYNKEDLKEFVGDRTQIHAVEILERFDNFHGSFGLKQRTSFIKIFMESIGFKLGKWAIYYREEKNETS